MIPKRTVLILGAGASYHLGFPLGQQLLWQVVQELRDEPNRLFRLLLDCGFEAAPLKEFRRALELSGQPSVDLFLENRRTFLDIGKAAMAALLIRHESEASLRRPPEQPNWYADLFARIGSSLEEFASSQLAILTFNYDRSIDHYLFLSLQNSFDLTTEKCLEYWRQVRVIHLYGQLGALPYADPKGRPYTADVSTPVLQRYAGAIKIMHEDVGDDTEFPLARTLLSRAEVVCFLGFGYHPTNMRRLRLDQLDPKVQLWGSATGLSRAQQDEIRSRFARSITVGNQTQDARDFLRNHRVFG